MPYKRRLFATCLLITVMVGLLALLSHAWWLPWIGEALVSSDTPEPADLIVVLGGDFWGHRVLEGARLAVRGYAPHVLISGPDYWLNGVPYPEGVLATKFLVEKGYPQALFWTFSHHVSSTMGEAKLLALEIKRLKIRRVLIVTSNYHSRRASIIFHALLPFLKVRVIGVSEDYFQPGSWWQMPYSRRLTQSEWAKLIVTLPLGLILLVRSETAGLLPGTLLARACERCCLNGVASRSRLAWSQITKRSYGPPVAWRP